MIRFGRGLCVAIVSIVGATCLAQAPITNGLMARWTGDGNAKDSAGHFDGQVSGALRYVPGPAAAQAFQFGGGAAKVDFGNSAGNFGTRDFTIAYWMKTDSKNPKEAFLSKRPTCDAGSPFWDIRIGGEGLGTGVPGMELSHGGYTAPDSLPATRAINDGRWHHLVWVRESTSSGTIAGLVYMDGALEKSQTYPEALDLVNQAPLVMGQNVCQCCDGTRPYSGAAAELQLFSHALSAEEILTLYNAEKSNK
jgi:hypothetical protein